MPISLGIDRTLYYKDETTWGDQALSGASAKTLRRVTHGLQMTKETYRSAEIVGHKQIQDSRHGGVMVQGPINGELSPGTYADFFRGGMRRAWTTVTAITAMSITITGTANPYTVTRGAGDFLTGGIKRGMVGALTAGTFNVNNLNKRFLILNVTATALTVVVPDGFTMTAEGPIASATLTIPGKVNYAPGTGHITPVPSFAFEDWHPSMSPTQSERYWGNRVGSIAVNIPPSGMSTIAVGMMGRHMTVSTTQWATGITAPTSTGVAVGNTGVVAAGATMTQQLAYTSAQFSIDTGISGEKVIGSNYTPDIFPGRTVVSGSITALFESATMRDEFIAETESGLLIWMKADGLAAGSFLSFAFPRVKWSSATKGDGEKGVPQTLNFDALYNAAGGTGIQTEQTSVWIQDSDAP